MHRLALAVQFLTILPWPRGTERQPEDLGGSMAFYPVVGAMLGCLMVGVHLFGTELFPDAVLRPTLIFLLTLMTGGLHLDGLADVCDGFYAGRTQADTLRIMKDPHVGSMAVLGIVGAVLMKVVLLSHLPSVMLYSALLVFPVVSRTAMVWGTWIAPYARADGGTGEVFFRTLHGRHVWFATGFFCIYIALFAGWPASVVMAFAVAGTMAFVGYCRRRIGGMTGDTLGALNELLEILTLAVYYPLGRWHITPAPLVNLRGLW